MTLHDWAPLPSGLFHHFHQDWSVEIARALNRGLLPDGYAALVEQRSGPVEGDVLTIEETDSPSDLPAQTAVMERPRARIISTAHRDYYAARANRVVVRHHLGRIVAVIEIVSPGNKSSRGAMNEFVEKTLEFLRAGVHVLLIDLLPPTARDPQGVHALIWENAASEDFEFPEDKDRLLVSYESGADWVAFVEPIAVGDRLPDMPLFLAPGWFKYAPLEATYQATWDASPASLRRAVETARN
jgi:hypothetical protein